MSSRIVTVYPHFVPHGKSWCNECLRHSVIHGDMYLIRDTGVGDPVTVSTCATRDEHEGDDQ